MADKNINKVQDKLKILSKKFNEFIKENKIIESDEKYILYYIEHYTKEIYFMKNFIFLINNDNEAKEEYNETIFKNRLVEINDFIKKLNNIIKKNKK